MEKSHSKEEIDAILQTFPESFRHRFEEDLNLKDVESFLLSLLDKRKHEHIERAFATLSTPSIKLFLMTLNEMQRPKEPKKRRKNTKEDELMTKNILFGDAVSDEDWLNRKQNT